MLLPDCPPYIMLCRYVRTLLAFPQRIVGLLVSFAGMTVTTPASRHTFPIRVGGTKGNPRARAGQQSLRRPGTFNFPKKASVHGFPAAANHDYRRRPTQSLLRLRPSSCMFHVLPQLLGRLNNGRLASALPWQCFPAAAASSSSRIPPLIRPYPPRLHKLLRCMPHTPKWDGI
jgi:hypothetical protein